ncbi:MAG: hypothetical protein ACLPX5_00215 [Dissulfurispiraceae bacterium]
MVAGILVFGLVVFMTSLLIARRSAICDKGEIATYIAVIAWGSMVFGLYISKFIA